jgi:GYF domain 2
LSLQRQSSLLSEEASSNEEQWYISVDEKTYGPIRFSDLEKLVRQGDLLKDHWVWQPGLASWITAENVTGLFPEGSPYPSKPSPSEPSQPDRRGRETKETREPKRNLKERAKDQVKNFALMFFYLWIVFGLLAIHQSIILSQYRIDSLAHGLAIVNALIFAKVMLVAEDLHLGNRLNDKPLIFPILFKSILFGVTLICFHIAEHVIVGMWHGKSAAESISEVGANRLKEVVSGGIITTVALVPFFILREISRVIGGNNFWALFFQRREPTSR